MNLSKLSIHDYQIQAFEKRQLKVELNFEKCNQMKSDNSKLFTLKDSRTCWDEKWKHMGLGFLIFIKAIPKALKVIQILTL